MRPTAALDHHLDALRHDAGEVLVQPAAGDVGDAVHHALDAIVAKAPAGWPDVNPRRLQEGLADRPAQFLDVVVDLQPGHVEDDLPGEAVAVGVQPGGGQAQDHVVGGDRASR